jgi:hypothetical protein
MPIWSMKFSWMCNLVTNLQIMILDHKFAMHKRFGHSVTTAVSLVTWPIVFCEYVPHKIVFLPF